MGCFVWGAEGKGSDLWEFVSLDVTPYECMSWTQHTSERRIASFGRAARATEESVSRERKTDIAVVVGSGRMVVCVVRLSWAVTLFVFANLCWVQTRAAEFCPQTP